MMGGARDESLLAQFKKTKKARQCIALNQHHLYAFDFRVIEDEDGNKAMLFYKESDMYQTDSDEFRYRTIILYTEGRSLATNDHQAVDYVLAEGLDGQWSIIKLTTRGKDAFTDVATILTGCSSELDGLAQFNNRTGLDLTDGNVWARVDQAMADQWVKKDLERRTIMIQK